MNSHLSGLCVAAQLMPPSRNSPGRRTAFLCGVAPNRVYMAAQSPVRRWALTPPFHPYRNEFRRYISVALSLGSPPAAVSRYSCPVELGLSSGIGFHHLPAAVQPARLNILVYNQIYVNNSFRKAFYFSYPKAPVKDQHSTYAGFQNA